MMEIFLFLVSLGLALLCFRNTFTADPIPDWLRVGNAVAGGLNLAFAVGDIVRWLS